MRTLEVAYLSGPDLDRAVIKALGWYTGAPDMGGQPICVLRPTTDPASRGWPDVVGEAVNWAPSRQDIVATLLADIHGLTFTVDPVPGEAFRLDFVAHHPNGAVGKCSNGYSNCREVAICRCLVASKFGETVELP